MKKKSIYTWEYNITGAECMIDPRPTHEMRGEQMIIKKSKYARSMNITELYCGKRIRRACCTNFMNFPNVQPCWSRYYSAPSRRERKMPWGCHNTAAIVQVAKLHRYRTTTRAFANASLRWQECRRDREVKCQWFLLSSVCYVQLWAYKVPRYSGETNISSTKRLYGKIGLRHLEAIATRGR